MNLHRKTRRRIEKPDHARCLTCSCYKRRPLLGEADVRDAVADQLMRTRARLGFRLVAWVLMPEHVHLLVVTGSATTVPQILMAIKRPVSTRLLRAWRERRDPRLELAATADGTHRLWQAGGGHDRNVVTGHDLSKKVRYIHENPVRRGLVERAEEWAWSSARAWARAETRWPELDRAPSGATG